MSCRRRAPAVSNQSDCCANARRVPPPALPRVKMKRSCEGGRIEERLAKIGQLAQPQIDQRGIGTVAWLHPFEPCGFHPDLLRRPDIALEGIAHHQNLGGIQSKFFGGMPEDCWVGFEKSDGARI